MPLNQFFRKLDDIVEIENWKNPGDRHSEFMRRLEKMAARQQKRKRR